MKVLVISNIGQENELRLKKAKDDVQIIFKNKLSEETNLKSYNAFFILNNEESDFIDFNDFDSKPVFINSVVRTLKEWGAPGNVSRINGWPGFLQRDVWEIASEEKGATAEISKTMGWNLLFVEDKPGFIAARVVAMIINEAFLAFNENVSTMEEVDLAMKLGTSYPFGPFEWAEKIGLNNVYALLDKLAETDVRCVPSPALKNCI
ncbi:MAG TPA: 3-hydroxyacyl-CoA dehydrogenase family protein [Hanamia sp.]|nr:3-hydroxyacyl-CoA dehydrogenase family protein [Hanamia sp.]